MIYYFTNKYDITDTSFCLFNTTVKKFKFKSTQQIKCNQASNNKENVISKDSFMTFSIYFKCSCAK